MKHKYTELNLSSLWWSLTVFRHLRVILIFQLLRLAAPCSLPSIKNCAIGFQKPLCMCGSLWLHFPASMTVQSNLAIQAKGSCSTTERQALPEDLLTSTSSITPALVLEPQCKLLLLGAHTFLVVCQCCTLMA